MKQAVLWLLPTIGLASVGAMTYATSSPHDGDGSKKSGPVLKTKVVHFAHEEEMDAYVTSIRSYMLVPPRDGRFGASRVPTFHGRNISSVPGYKDISELGKENGIVSYVLGVMPRETIQGIQDFMRKNPTQHNDIPKYRATVIHALYHSAVQQPTESRETAMQAFKSIQKVKQKVDKEGYDTYSEAVTLDGHHGYIVAKAVYSVDKSCYSCHSTIKEGQPIGHVIAAIWKKAP